MIHHVAQNLSITTFPNKSPERTILPSRLGRLKAGMAFRCCTAVKPLGAVLVCTVQPVPRTPEDPATRNSLLFICFLLESRYRFYRPRPGVASLRNPAGTSN